MVVAAAARASGLGTLRRGCMAAGPPGGAVFLLFFFDLRRSFGLCRSFGRAAGFFLGLEASFFDCSLFRLAVLFRAAALLLTRFDLGAVLASAGLLERGEARLLGFAQKL